MKKLLAWLQASRLMSQPYILLPLLFGQGLYLRQTVDWSIKLFIITICFSLLVQLYIVYANDYADEAVDKANTTYNVFSAGSRVLVEKKLTRIPATKIRVCCRGRVSVQLKDGHIFLFFMTENLAIRY
jgi:1,4-dihydroxy-2-naphthoate octaprenyltransferase